MKNEMRKVKGRNERSRRNFLIVTTLFLLLILTLSSSSSFPSSFMINGIPIAKDVVAASLSPPIGSCFSSGNTVITTSIYWANLNCIVNGNITIANGGSFRMANSSLRQEGTNSLYVNLTGTSTFTMINSSIYQVGGNLTRNQIMLVDDAKLSVSLGSVIDLNGTGKLQLLGNSTAQISQSSYNGSIYLYNFASILANQGSNLELYKLASLGSSSFFLVSSNLVGSSYPSYGGPGSILVEGSKMMLNYSTLTLSNFRSASLAAFQSSILNSQVSILNVSGVYIGNSTMASSQLSVLSSNISMQGLSTSTAVVGSDTNLTISNSSIIEGLSSVASSSARLTIVGAGVSITNSTVASINKGLYGYSANTSSALSINSTSSNLVIAGCRLLSGGSNSTPGIRQGLSNLLLSSYGNLTISNSVVQSSGSNASVTIAANTPSIVGDATIRSSLIENAGSPGRINLFASYELVLNDTEIQGENSAFSIRAYSFSAENSNITGQLTFSPLIGQSTLINTTVSEIKVLPDGAYSSYGWLFVHVVSGNSTKGISNASVFAIDPASNQLVYSAQTNSSGWVRILTLISKVNSTSGEAFSKYIIQVMPKYGNTTTSSLSQRLVTSNNSYLLTVEADENLSANLTSDFADASPSNLASLVSNYHLANSSIDLTPKRLYLNEYTPSIVILSNAIPLGAANNYSSDQFSFSTVGVGGSTFYFFIVYPNNLTQSAPTVSVDGILIHARITSNQTQSLLVFSVPSGQHYILLSYVPSSAVYTDSTPLAALYPGRTTILVVALLGVLGGLFAIVFARRQDKKFDSTLV